MGRTIRTCNLASALVLLTLAVPARADVPAALTDYARARVADAAGDSRTAVANYRAVLQASPDNAVVAIRAYREALVVGDIALAREAADILARRGAAPPDSAVLDVAAAIRGRRWQAASTAADRLANGSLEFLAPAIKAWVAFDRGVDASEVLLDPAAANVLARRFNLENRALLLIARGKPEAGMAEIRSLVGSGNDNVGLRITAAQLLAARGRRDVGEGLLVGDDAALVAARRQLATGMKPDAAFGVSRLLVRLASDIVGGEAKPLAILLCRAALELDPTDDRARLTLAGALSNAGAQPPALALLGEIDPRSAYASSAQTMAITVHARSGDPAAGLAVAERAAAAKGADAEDYERLGDLLVGAGRYPEGADAYAAAIERGKDADWTLTLARGGALEQAGRWDEALPLLRRAVDLARDEPHALNYLGYAQVERGENLVAARKLLERASALQPDDAAITDSLGWAYVRTGQTARALPLLERAARAEPGDATINEHLGDAYWLLGRRYEARYAWRAATVGANATEAARLAIKLVSGLAGPSR